MRIDPLIDGRARAGSDYFETLNPATQQVLAEVAAGSAEEVDAAVAAAKAAFPKRAGLAASERARRMRRLGALGWDAYAARAEVVTPNFGSSGAGQINAILPLTPRLAGA